MADKHNESVPKRWARLNNEFEEAIKMYRLLVQLEQQAEKKRLAAEFLLLSPEEQRRRKAEEARIAAMKKREELLVKFERALWYKYNNRVVTWRSWIAAALRRYKGIVVSRVPKHGTAFRVKFPEGYPFAEVSCCVPSDDKTSFETLLYGANGRPIYIIKLRYDEPKRFETVLDLVEEIKQLYNNASNLK